MCRLAKFLLLIALIFYNLYFMQKYLLSSIMILFIATVVSQAQTTTLWGLTFSGGKWNYGAIIKTDAMGNEDTVHSFGNGTDGQYPYGNLIKASNGLLYGMTAYGGANKNIYPYMGDGIIFSYNIATGTETDVHDFTGTDGANPVGSLLQASNGLLYGITNYAGTDNYGTFFSYDISTGKDSVLFNFNFYGTGNLFQASTGIIYGMTSNGGSGGWGQIFSYNISTNTYSVLHDFKGYPTDGIQPYGGFIQVKDSLLYGLTEQGGIHDAGTLFSFNIYTDSETVLHNFCSSCSNDGFNPRGSLIQADDGLLYGMTWQGGAYDSGIIFSYNIALDTEIDIHDFGKGADGKFPTGSLIQAKDSLLCGMTFYGGAYGAGTAFTYNPTKGIYTDIHDFGSSTDGAGPYGDLLEDDTTITTGNNQLSVNTAQFSIYPNPTSGQFTIKSKCNQNGYIAKVYNVIGQLVYQSVLGNSQNSIDLLSQPTGLYFVYLKSGQDVEVGKVMITR